jgi:hypothetical protein
MLRRTEGAQRMSQLGQKRRLCDVRIMSDLLATPDIVRSLDTAAKCQ